MFGKQELLDQIETLTNKNEELVQSLKDKNQKQRNVVYDDIDGSTHVFDWEAARAFSIERNMRYEYGELEAYTIIGYQRNVNEDGNICNGEWSFVCSQAQHNKLAKEFEEYLFSKRVKDFNKKSPPQTNQVPKVVSKVSKK